MFSLWLRERNEKAAAGLIAAAVTIIFVLITSWNGVQNDEGRFSENLRHRRAVADNDCQWKLTVKDTRSTLTSPNYPDNYPSNKDCQWLITAHDPGATVSLRIDTLAIEEDLKCRLDYLVVYLGDNTQAPSLGPFCGIIKDQLIETNTSRVLLEFHSDMVGEEKGFSIDYFSLERECKETLTARSGTLVSPGFPMNYPDDSDCWTLITAGEGGKVNLTFDFIDLEFGENCTFDYLQVLDGETTNSSLLAHMCQELTTRSFESSASSLLVYFHSDDTVNRRGYRARYKLIDKRSAPEGECLWVKGIDNGTISSPNHPGNYPKASYCSIWILAPESSTIIIDIDRIDVEKDQRCSFDYLKISEGSDPDSKLLGRFCGWESEPKRVVSSRHDVRIQFDSDEFLEYSGFKLRYHIIREETEGEETTEEAVLSFSVTPQNVTLSEGSSFMLSCDTRHPNARIRWTKDDVFLTSEAPLPGLKFMSNNSLWIRSMNQHLEGMYTCVAVSPESEVKTSAYVAMTESPLCDVDLIKTPSDAEYPEDDFAHVECMSLREQTVLTWEKDGRPLVTDDRVKLLPNGFIYMTKIRREDAGTYTCVAKDTVSGCVRRVSAILEVNKRPSMKEVCGKVKIKQPKKESQNDHGKIVGGNDAVEGSYPWQVMLWYPILGPFCGATLINERWLVTAAHCLINDYTMTWDKIRMLLGKHERQRFNEPEVEAQLAGPSSVWIHPSYHKATFDNDLALLRLSRPVMFTDRVLPVCLGDRNVTEALLSAGTMGTVIGWGKLKQFGFYPRYLQEVALPIVDQAQCKESTNYTVTRNMFCAGYAQDVIGDACAGDSGGPFLAKHEGRWYIVGVVSWGEGCGKRGKYGFYTRIANQLSWIQGVISVDHTNK